jgi:hypothetical protein
MKRNVNSSIKDLTQAGQRRQLSGIDSMDTYDLIVIDMEGFMNDEL